MTPQLTAAIEYHRAGLSVIPIRADGSKAPALPKNHDVLWRRRRATELEITVWHKRLCGIAIQCGAVSGHLEVLDFDKASLYPEWCEIIRQSSHDLFDRLTIVKSPKGYHLWYRCAEIERSAALARYLSDETDKQGNPKIKVAIETRGEGSSCIAPPSPAECNHLGIPYTYISGHLTALNEITPTERRMMIEAARRFNEVERVEPQYQPRRVYAFDAQSPVDDYNARGDWHALLTSHGWRYVGRSGSTERWQKPDASERKVSATVNADGTNRLYVWSTSVWPFEAGRFYSLWAAYTLLECGGDFKESRRRLYEQGYGERESLPEAIRITDPVRPLGHRIADPTRQIRSDMGAR